VGGEYRMGRDVDIDYFKPGNKQGVYILPILTR